LARLSTATLSKTVYIGDGFGEGFRSFLRQIVIHSQERRRDVPVDFACFMIDLSFCRAT
jgi:hypothetical protein